MTARNWISAKRRRCPWFQRIRPCTVPGFVNNVKSRDDTDRERILQEATAHGPITGVGLARLLEGLQASWLVQGVRHTGSGRALT